MFESLLFTIVFSPVSNFTEYGKVSVNRHEVNPTLDFEYIEPSDLIVPSKYISDGKSIYD